MIKSSILDHKHRIKCVEKSTDSKIFKDNILEGNIRTCCRWENMKRLFAENVSLNIENAILTDYQICLSRQFFWIFWYFSKESCILEQNSDTCVDQKKDASFLCHVSSKSWSFTYKSTIVIYISNTSSLSWVLE